MSHVRFVVLTGVYKPLTYAAHAQETEKRIDDACFFSEQTDMRAYTSCHTKEQQGY